MHALQRKNKAQKLLCSGLFLCFVHVQLKTSCLYSERNKTDFLSGYLVSRSLSTCQLKKCDWLADFDVATHAATIHCTVRHCLHCQVTARVLDMFCFSLCSISLISLNSICLMKTKLLFNFRRTPPRPPVHRLTSHDKGSTKKCGGCFWLTIYYFCLVMIS